MVLVIEMLSLHLVTPSSSVFSHEVAFLHVHFSLVGVASLR